jgi:TonB-linked SusC/RagA family outer membrane protein
MDIYSLYNLKYIINKEKLTLINKSMTDLINETKKASRTGFYRLRVLLMYALLVLSLPVFSQNITVKGMVTDSQTGEVMIGVNVVLKGTIQGTNSDITGQYILNNCPPSATLVFTYVGYTQMEVAVSNRTVVDVTMTSASSALDEVVIVAYGTARRSDLTGSMASISGDKLKRIPMSNAADAMKGRLSGVNILTTDGSPDAEIVIRVRGGGSVTQDNSPLYVVDGFIVSSIRDIPTSDITSINVLKDAAATAIYGAQAANGVILVTTKNPVAGKTSVNYNGYIQIKQLPKDRKLEVLSPYEYASAQYEYARLRSDADVRNFEKYFGKYADLDLYLDKKPTDWQDELFGNPQLSQLHNISITGGTEKTKLSLSFTNNNDQGLLVGSGYKRNVINFKLNHEIFKSLQFESSTRITTTVVDGAGTSGTSQLRVKDAIVTRPVNGVADELDIDLTQVDSNNDYQSFLLSMINPLELAKQDWRKRNSKSYVINAGLAWSILKNLTAKTTFTTETSFDESYRYYGPLTSESQQNGSSLPLGTISQSQNLSYRWLNTLNYEFLNIGLHKLDILLGQEIYSAGGKGNNVRTEDFRVSMQPEEMFANMALGNTVQSSTYVSTNQNRSSFFGRANYMYNNKYLLTATIRTDASSKFSKENRLGIFPAVALGWKISEENFMKNSGLFQELKLRASYGQTGNDRIPANATRFLFKAPGMGTNAYNAYYSPEGSTLFNPNIVWETTINRNAGLDFSLFKSRLSGSIDFYYNTTKDLLLASAISPISGFSTQWNNIGSTSNKGMEIVLNGRIIDNDNFTLSANLNIGMNRSKIEELDGTNERFYQSNWASTDLKDRDDFYLAVGRTIGLIYGYVTDGFYSVDDFSGYNSTTGQFILKTPEEGVYNDKSVLGVANLRPGYLKLLDANGDSVINSLDRKVIGSTLPKSTGGFGLDLRYKGFDASLFFNYSIGNDIYNTGKIEFNQYYRTTFGNMLSTMSSDKRFTYIDVDGTLTGTAGGVVTDLEQLRILNQDKNIWSGNNSFGQATAVIHSWAVEDGSFLRLNTLTVGYSLPKSIINKLHMSLLRVYVTGNNLALFTKYSGYDPEVSSTRSNNYAALTPGIDYSAYPRSRSYTFGINVTF